MSNIIDLCPTGYDYEQYQLNELENENRELKKKLDIAVKALKEYTIDNWIYEDEYNNYPKHSGGWYYAEQALKELKGK